MATVTGQELFNLPTRIFAQDVAASADAGICRAMSDTNDPAKHRQRLLDGGHFSQWFIVTYQAAACAMLLLFTLRHWYIRLSRHRRTKRRKTLTRCSSRHDSGTQSPGEQHKNGSTERSPLLLNGPGLSSSHSHLTRLMLKIRALGMYQPPPIPLLQKTIPSISASITILLLLSINIFYALYKISWPYDLSFVLSDRCGLLFSANLPWLYLTAAKNQPIKFLTGYSYENLNILHRRIGELLCLLALLHAVGMFMAWYCFLLPTGMDLWTYLSHRIIILGLAAFFCYEALYFTSLASFRQWWYEVFLGSHIVLQAGGLAFLFFHQRGHNGGVYSLVALAIFLVDRLVFRIMLKTRSVRADCSVMDDGETVLLSADWPLPYRWRSQVKAIFGLNVWNGWKPTEHVFLTIPELAKKHFIQAHPFTIASAAPESGQEHAWFNLIIRAHDGFTRDLVKYAKNHTSVTTRLDGPYGSLHALEMLWSSDAALIVVGGSGIAVAYPLIWTLLHESDAETGSGRRKVGLIWIVHDASHISWIGHERLDELVAKGLKLCIPPPTSKAGRPDTGALVRSMTSDMVKEEDMSVGVVVSGPDGMNRSVRNTCASMAWEGVDIDVAVEKYGW